MTPTLLLRLLPGDTGQVRWATIDRDGRVEARGHHAPDTLAGRADGYRIVALVPTEEVLLTRVTIPTRNHQKRLQAIPFALEDQLVSDIDDLHFAAGAPDAAGASTVVVVAHERMHAWTKALDRAGLTPAHMTADALALPERAGAWTALLEDGRFAVRTGTGTGFAGETENLAALLEAALSEHAGAVPDRLLTYGGTPPENAALPLPVEPGNQPLDAALAERAGHGALELRQGRHTIAGAERSRWRPWIPAAALLVALIVLDTGRLLAERWQLQGELAALETRVESVFREVFPDANRVVAPRSRMERRLEQLEGGETAGDGDLLDTLLAIGPHLNRTDGLRLGSLNWRTDTLELDVNADSLQQLDRLKQTLDGENGFTAELRQARSEDDTVQGRLILRREAS
ncbi:type II secretion system protein GspL [Aquisalimonas asiatica]|uniref:Type II secretion system protein L n=1 Tax=Aquisalimonas asiatica TaxID=406100 RepID=A0A1H8VLA9_9GAMM|nr:type II secretion system protein GspL [Aquisalimonas asiatica]SEP16201.1 general secretion pathway protein L [Aquisalimonas asiatica]